MGVQGHAAIRQGGVEIQDALGGSVERSQQVAELRQAVATNGSGEQNGVDASSEVVVSDKIAPADVFEIPEGSRVEGPTGRPHGT